MGWPVDDTWRDSLTSPHSSDWTMAAIRSGAVLADGMEASSVTLVESVDDRQITRELRATITDPDGTLLGDDTGAPLAPFGQQIRARHGLGVGAAWSQSIPAGDFRIEESERTGGTSTLLRNGTWLPGGQSVAVICRDMLQQLAGETWETVAAPKSGATVAAELARVIAGTGVRLASSVTSTVKVTAEADYGACRLDAVLTLAGLAGAVVWCDRAGALALIDATAGTGTSWSFTPGEDVGVDRSPKMSRDGLHNGVIVKGSDGDDRYGVRGSAAITSGPLRWGGPFGRVPTTITDQTIHSNAAATARAQRERDALASSQTVTVTITAPDNPAVDCLDRAVIPTDAGTMSGLIRSIDRDGDGMKLSVAVPWQEVWHV